MPELILALDAGTTNLRACVFTPGRFCLSVVEEGEIPVAVAQHLVLLVNAASTRDR